MQHARVKLAFFPCWRTRCSITLGAMERLPVSESGGRARVGSECSASVACLQCDEPIKMCDVCIDRWELYKLVKRCGWENAAFAGMIKKALLRVLEQWVLSKAGRKYLGKKRIASFVFRPSSKWVQCGRMQDRFRSRNEQVAEHKADG